MWVLKGLSLGLGLFVVGSIVYIFVRTMPHEQGKATSVGLLLRWTAFNVFYWAAFVATVALSLWFVKPHA